MTRIALFLERLAGLRSRVVELAGLPDDDGAGADDQHALDVGTLWHWFRALRARRGRPRILAARVPSIALAHHRREAREQMGNVVGAGTGLRMALKTECRTISSVNSLK